MKILVVGSGLIGVTTAYFLHRRGHQVLVIDKEGSAGQGASFANGALLTPSMAEPWNSPGCWKVLLRSLVRPDSPIRLHLGQIPAMAHWGRLFLHNSGRARFAYNARSNFRLAIYSLKCLQSLSRIATVEFGHSARGTLRIFGDRIALANAVATSKSLATEGLSFRELSGSETTTLEPALEPIASRIVGAVHYETDESGDAYRFCGTLSQKAKEAGVEFVFCAEAQRLEYHRNRIVSVIVDQRQFVADRYVIAAGTQSTPLLRTVGIRLPVQPAKGYSITFDEASGRRSLAIPVVDDSLHAAVVPLEGGIRVAGTAEFAGYDRTIDPKRIENLMRLLHRILPHSNFDLSAGKPWCGLRPMSADGVPIIGCTKFANLFVNVGHGHLGWTMATGSAQLLTEVISGDAPTIDPTAYSLARFLS